MSLFDLTTSCGKTSAPGLKVNSYWVDIADIDTFPALKAPGSPGDAITLDGDITLLATKKFFQIVMRSKTGKVVDTSVGEEGAKSWDSQLEFSILGLDPDHLEFAKCVLNGCWVVIACTKDGIQRVFGNPDEPAKIDEITLDSGAAPGDVSGGSYILKADGPCPAPVYEGVIDTTA